jgi:hypothetical protein
MHVYSAEGKKDLAKACSARGRHMLQEVLRLAVGTLNRTDRRRSYGASLLP